MGNLISKIIGALLILLLLALLIEVVIESQGNTCWDQRHKDLCYTRTCIADVVAHVQNGDTNTKAAFRAAVIYAWMIHEQQSCSKGLFSEDVLKYRVWDYYNRMWEWAGKTSSTPEDEILGFFSDLGADDPAMCEALARQVAYSGTAQEQITKACNYVVATLPTATPAPDYRITPATPTLEVRGTPTTQPAPSESALPLATQLVPSTETFFPTVPATSTQPLRPTPVPATRAPTKTPTRLPPPVWGAIENPQSRNGCVNTWITWSWGRGLGDDEWFEIQVYKSNKNPSERAKTAQVRDSSRKRLAEPEEPLTDGSYEVQVLVVRREIEIVNDGLPKPRQVEVSFPSAMLPVVCSQ